MPPRPPPRPDRQTAYDLGEPGRATSPLAPRPERQDYIPTQRVPQAAGELDPVTEVLLPEDLALHEAPPEPEPRPAARAQPARSGPAPALRSRSPSPGRNDQQAAPARSDRRPVAPGRSGRSASASGRRSAPMPAVPSEDGAGGSHALTTLLIIALGVLGALVITVGLLLWSAPARAERQAAEAALAEAERQQQRVAAALAQRRPVEAEAALAAARAALATPALANPAYAERVRALEGELAAAPPRIAALVAEQAVAGHWAKLRERLARLSDPATDLAALEREVAAFAANPLDPQGPPSAQAAQAHAGAVAEARRALADIARERERRQRDLAQRVLHETRQALAPLLAEDRFGAALAELAARRQQWPGIDFQPLEAQVQEAAATAWQVVRRRVELALRDAESPGATPSQRQAVLRDARQRLERVIERYGMPELVAEAAALQARLPAPR